MTDYQRFDFLSMLIFTIIMLPLILSGIAKSMAWSERKDPTGKFDVWAILGAVLIIVVVGVMARQLIFFLLEDVLGMRRPPLTRRTVGRFRYISNYNTLGGICGVVLWYVVGKLFVWKKQKKTRLKDGHLAWLFVLSVNMAMAFPKLDEPANNRYFSRLQHTKDLLYGHDNENRKRAILHRMNGEWQVYEESATGR